MDLRKALRFRPALMVLAVAMMAIALACAGEEAVDEPVVDQPSVDQPSVDQPTVDEPTVDEPSVTEPDVTAPVDVSGLGWGAQEVLSSPGYQAEWGEPVYGGILKMRHPWAASRFQPNGNSVFHSNHGPPLYHDTLLQYDPWVGVDRIVPRLAESWEISEDGKTYTFKLREGVKFQDNPNSTAPAMYLGEQVKGDEFTCEDVVASLEFHAFPPTTEPNNLTGPIFLSHINEVTCPDGPKGYTAVFNADLPRAATLGGIAEGGFVMFDKDWLAWYNAEHPGLMNKGTRDAMMIASSAGPWQPKDFSPDIIMKMEKNPNYFMEGLPFADEWHLIYISDFATAFTALATGQVHIFGACSGTMQPGQVLQAERDFQDTIKVSRSRHGMGQGTSYNTRVPPFDDLRVRQALNLAYDRQGWYEFKNVSSLGAGLTYSGIYPSDRPFGHTEAEVLTWPGLNPNTKEADIKAANDLLDEVFGVGKRFKASLEPSNQANYIDIALYTADQLGKDLGIEFSIMVNEPAVSRERSLSGVKSLGPGTAGVATWFGDPDDALLRWHPDYMSPTGLKNAGPAFADAEARFASMHADMLTQRTIMDIDKRRALTRSIVEEAHDLAVNLQLGWNVLFYGEVPALGGFVVPDFGVVIGMGLYERLWLTDKTRYEN